MKASECDGESESISADEPKAFAQLVALVRRIQTFCQSQSKILNDQGCRTCEKKYHKGRNRTVRVAVKQIHRASSNSEFRATHCQRENLTKKSLDYGNLYEQVDCVSMPRSIDPRYFSLEALTPDSHDCPRDADGATNTTLPICRISKALSPSSPTSLPTSRSYTQRRAQPRQLFTIPSFQKARSDSANPL